MTIFFTGDTHFNHENIIRYCDRPFLDIRDHNERIIENWNKAITKQDTVYHLGDFGFGPIDELINILKRLNGQIHLLKGNHDRLNATMRKMFVSVSDIKEIKVKDDEMDVTQKIVLCHYPMSSWNGETHGSWMLHGHSHGMLNIKDDRLDVGVDNNYYKPFSYEEVKTIFTVRIMRKTTR